MGILGGGGTLGGGERNCKGDKGKMGDLEPTRLFNPVGTEKRRIKCMGNDKLRFLDRMNVKCTFRCKTTEFTLQCLHSGNVILQNLTI